MDWVSFWRKYFENKVSDLHHFFTIFVWVLNRENHPLVTNWLIPLIKFFQKSSKSTHCFGLLEEFLSDINFCKMLVEYRAARSMWVLFGKKITHWTWVDDFTKGMAKSQKKASLKDRKKIETLKISNRVFYHCFTSPFFVLKIFLDQEHCDTIIPVQFRVHAGVVIKDKCSNSQKRIS